MTSAAPAAVAAAVLPFWGSESFMSNFHPCAFTMDGHEFKSSEQAFMYLKSKTFHDDEILQKILDAPTPHLAKKLGRMVRGFDDDVWCGTTARGLRYECMLEVLRAKFSVPELRAKLLETGTALLVEASPRDHTWGVGVGAEKAMDPKNWRGVNLLGTALMQVRAEIAGTDAPAAEFERADTYDAGMRERRKRATNKRERSE